MIEEYRMQEYEICTKFQQFVEKANKLDLQLTLQVGFRIRSKTLNLEFNVRTLEAVESVIKGFENRTRSECWKAEVKEQEARGFRFNEMTMAWEDNK